MVTKWRLSGFLLGECNCDWGCPCSFDAPPTHGGCHGVYTWVVDKGTYGDVKLDGLAFALPGTFPKPSTSVTRLKYCSETRKPPRRSAKPSRRSERDVLAGRSRFSPP